MNALQGYVLFSSDRGGMRIEFAKNKMGEGGGQSNGQMNGTINGNGLTNGNGQVVTMVSLLSSRSSSPQY